MTSVKRHLTLTNARPSTSLEYTDHGVIHVYAKDVPHMIQEEGGAWTILDVRPVEDATRHPLHDQLSLTGSRKLSLLNVPMYVPDTSNSAEVTVKRALNALFGIRAYYILNRSFLDEVRALAPPPHTRLLVVCQQGLRSMAAANCLSKDAGYENVSWLVGGIDAMERDGARAGSDVWTAWNAVKVAVVVLAVDALIFIAHVMHHFWRLT